MAADGRGLLLHITEDHNQVLEHIYRAIGSKKLSFSDNTLLHFDSHPDLLIPQDISATDVYSKEELFSSISIENWIMPALYAGHISKVIWLKKQWANQIEDGLYEFSVGMDKATSRIRCSCTEPYFVSELLYLPKDQLLSSKEVTLRVVTLDNTDSLKSACDVLKGLTDSQNIILDIDLDYFSTTNPFLGLYSKSQLGILSTLYRFHEEATPELSSIKREEQLQFISAAIKTVATQLSGTSTSKSEDLIISDDKRMELVRSLVQEEMDRKGIVDGELLHEHGCTFDTCGLPHYISSNLEITKSVDDMIQLLSMLKINPKIITIARSSVDDYCPRDQVDIIQDKLLHSLSSLYSTLNVKKHYLTD